MKPTLTLNVGHDVARTIDTEESFERFRTISFGLEWMLSTIRIDTIGHRLYLATWYAAIPGAYRDAVLPVIQEVFERHRGEKLVEETRYAFVLDLNASIAKHVAPVAP